jgi:hypothetical protein
MKATLKILKLGTNNPKIVYASLSTINNGFKSDVAVGFIESLTERVVGEEIELTIDGYDTRPHITKDGDTFNWIVLK